MSKLSKAFCLAVLPLSLIAQSDAITYGQDVVAKIQIESGSPSQIKVTGRHSESFSPANPTAFFFLKEYAGIERLGERITDVTLSDKRGQLIDTRQLIPGEYLASAPFQIWKYQFNAAPINKASSAAHVTWISADAGMLMLDNLLPHLRSKAGPATVRLEIILPAGWKVFSTEKLVGPNVFEVFDAEKAVFYLSNGVRTREIPLNVEGPSLFIDGTWPFSDSEAAEMATEVFRGYQELFKSDPASRANIYLLHFPQKVGHGTWEADTRGGSVTIVSSDMPFKNQSLQRLHEQLRHELFHLWVPNSLNLTGNYDWFYEGFALYISLKQGVAVNRLRFEDFLDTLSRAYNIENMQTSGLSLVQASADRWVGGNTRIYARGMLVAFLCDLALLERSNGKTSVESIIYSVAAKHGKKAPQADGNEAILKVFGSRLELSRIVQKYITGAEKIMWRNELLTAGIEYHEENLISRLKVIDNPRGRQKDLLNKLGYNNWRNLAPRSQ